MVMNHMDAKELKTRLNLVLKLLKYPNYWKSYGCFNVGLFSRLAEDFGLLWCALKYILRGTNGNMGSECTINILRYSKTLSTNFKFRLYILAVHFFFWLIYNHCHLLRPYSKLRLKKFAGIISRDLSYTITISWIVFSDICSIRSCFRLLRFANGLGHISQNSAFVIQFHTNYVRINYNKICVNYSIYLCRYSGEHGRWSTRQCFKMFENESHIKCECLHFTNFAVLFKVTDDSVSEKESLEREWANVLDNYVKMSTFYEFN